ncbi:EAL domain-containing protein [Vibrio tapetis subsp. quintayensis]|uniref:EAL domain-containing protein n=1 Tax=Vibrio tapetis TaxID=52443 RepID=UPI0025B4E1B5|nr:EAL domain-containing protein [Vibrio tapetis]MDN3680517.1 EAL domain-containing protein [Vibrio tapetis subsp. quintayensis]
MSQASKKRTIGVVLPMLSGFYMGEITAALRELAIKHHFNLIVIRVGHSRDFELPVAVSQIDALLVVLHCTSDALIKMVIDKNIPVISIGASYLPLKVEQITSNQSHGIELLYQWLVSQEHESIGFCGDLNINDIRMRFKAYQSQLEAHQHTLNTLNLFNVTDASLSGGREAAALYEQRQAPCSAIICATDYNAIGLIDKLKQSGKRIPQDLAVVGVDNVFLGAHGNQQLTSIDQQLELLTKLAIKRLLERLNGSPYNHCTHTVDQKLIVRSSCGSPKALRTTDVQLSSIRKDLLQNSDRSPAEVFETLYSQAQSGFDSLFNLQGLYNSSMQWACYASSTDSKFQITKISRKNVSHSETLNSPISGNVESFPPSHMTNLSIPEHSIRTLMPIASGEDKQWELLAVVDDLQSGCSINDYAMFNNYLDMLSLFLERDALLNTTQLRQQRSQDLLSQLQVVSNTSNDGIWDWDINSNMLHWNSRLVDMLELNPNGLQNSINCDTLFDCIHADDIEKLEKGISDHLLDGAPFRGSFRAKKKNGDYLWLQINGSAIYGSNGRPIRLIGSMTDITQQKVSAEKIHHMAYYDSLTGVPNRRMITEKLQHYTESNSSQSLAVMLMDLNRFKLVNDTFGHDVGDAVLCHVANKVKSVMRKGDICARLGGDEFLFVCPIAHPQQAREIAKRILTQIETPLTYQGLNLQSQGSLGIALFPQDATRFDDLIKKADIAMYRAKQFKSKQLTFYSRDMEGESKMRISIEQLLIKAIDKQEFEVWYQPQFDFTSNKAKGAEALIRWPSRHQGMISPAEFIPIAEESGLIGLIGQLVLTQVCQDLVSNPLLSQYNKVSINVSPYQLSQKHFADEVIQTILAHDLLMTQFCIEITETCVIENFEHALASLDKLHQAGIQIALDDFGTGYSSLSLLRQLPLSEVKIDRSFMQELTQQHASQTLVHSIITMCHAYGYIITAEGVETQEQMDLLRNLDCDLAQGFFLAKPTPLGDLPIHFPLEKESVKVTSNI